MCVGSHLPIVANGNRELRDDRDARGSLWIVWVHKEHRAVVRVKLGRVPGEADRPSARSVQHTAPGERVKGTRSVCSWYNAPGIVFKPDGRDRIVSVAIRDADREPRVPLGLLFVRPERRVCAADI